MHAGHGSPRRAGSLVEIRGPVAGTAEVLKQDPLSIRS